MTSVSIKELLEAGVHFGHQTQKWNPKCKPYIFGQRNGIYIIDLQKTLSLFRAACDFAGRLGQEGRTILFVGTKRQAQEAIREEAERSANFHVNQRWLGGLLTNWATVRRSVESLKRIEDLSQQDGWENMTKKEIARVEKKRTKLTKVFAGIKEMRRLPDALFVIDPKKERIAVLEAIRLGIPVMAVLDTNCDPDGIEYVIPGNDDAIRSIRLFAGGIADSYLEGARLYEARKAEREESRGAVAGAPAPVEGRVARPVREPEAAKEPPRKRITLTVPPGGQAPKPAGPAPVPPAHVDGSVKAN